ncbi:MAG: hypothetical protein Q8L29_03800, partial [archaeon]|nr:hypothetical protein [archaeon]
KFSFFTVNMRTYLKGGIIGFLVWIVFISIFLISGYLIKCEIDSQIVGISCWNPIQNFIAVVFLVLSFPFFLLGANPNLSTVGPNGVLLFWIGSLISFIIWGMLIGWLVGRRNKRKKLR